jgi:hypothetical protein
MARTACRISCRLCAPRLSALSTSYGVFATAAGGRVPPAPAELVASSNGAKQRRDEARDIGASDRSSALPGPCLPSATEGRTTVGCAVRALSERIQREIAYGGSGDITASTFAALWDLPKSTLWIRVGSRAMSGKEAVTARRFALIHGAGPCSKACRIPGPLVASI